MRVTLSEYLRETLKDSAVHLGRLREQEAGEPPMDMPMEVPEAAPADPDEAIKTGIEQAGHALWSSFVRGECDMAECMGKLKELGKFHGKMNGTSSSGGGGGKELEEPAEESWRNRPRNLSESDRLRLQLETRDLCAEMGVTPDKVLRAALNSAGNLAEARELIESSRAGRSEGTGPRSRAPSWFGGAADVAFSEAVRESRNHQEETPEARAARVSRLRSQR